MSSHLASPPPPSPDQTCEVKRVGLIAMVKLLGVGTILSSVVACLGSAPNDLFEERVSDNGDGAIEETDASTAIDTGTKETSNNGKKVCNGSETGNSDPRYGCGGDSCSPCASVRNTPVCSNGSCAIGTCEKGWASCDDKVENGCETNTQESATNCGACRSACAPGEVCSAGKCSTKCSGLLEICGGSCVDKDTSTSHCGTCNNLCDAPKGGTPVCDLGFCDYTCPATTRYCSAKDACEKESEQSCGSTCAVCPGSKNGNGTASCNTGKCFVNCNNGYKYDGAGGCTPNGTNPALCNPTNTCIGARDIGTVSGDLQSPVGVIPMLNASGSSPEWLFFRLTEDVVGFASPAVALSAKLTLQNTGAAMYDFRVYVNTAQDVAECKILAGNASTTGGWGISWPDAAAISDSRDVSVEIFKLGTTCTDPGGWSLNIQGTKTNN